MPESITAQLVDLLPLAVTWGGRLFLAIAALVAGFWLVGRVSSFVGRTLRARAMDASLQTFLSGLVNVLLKAAVFISVASMLGIETTSFVAMLGAAGLAVGLALQGSLANFAGGVLILLFKPFEVGDLIDGQGHFGHVREINVFVTRIETPESKTVVIPNGPLANGSITNLSRVGHLRVDVEIGVSYGADLAEAREVLLRVMREHPLVLDEPAPSVNVLALGDSSVNLAVRPYAAVADYWPVFFGVTEQAKLALDAAGIEIPFPQRVVHQAKG